MIVYLDIFTIPRFRDFHECEQQEPKLAKLWNEKFGKDEYLNKAGFYPEFNRIVSIGIGYDIATAKNTICIPEEGAENISEIDILKEFTKKIGKSIDSIGGMNVINFDIPLLYKKFKIHKLPVPHLIDKLIGKKPWEISNYVCEVSAYYNGGLGAYDNNSFNNIDVLSEIYGLEEFTYSAAEISKMCVESASYELAKKYVKRNVLNTIELYNILTKSHEN